MNKDQRIMFTACKKEAAVAVRFCRRPDHGLGHTLPAKTPLSRICNSARNISGFAIRKSIPESKYDSPDNLNGDNLAKRSRRRQLQIASCSERHYKCRSTGQRTLSAVLTLTAVAGVFAVPTLTAKTRCIASLQRSLTGWYMQAYVKRPDRGDRPVRVKPTLFPVRETISIEKRCAAARPKPRMEFHMMNLLRRLADVFRIDSMDMNALTGNVNSTTVRVDRINKFKKSNK